MIGLKNICFRYGSENSQNTGELKNINLTVGGGELVLISGPSGCGKTTVLRLINGLIPRFYRGILKGDVLLDGRSFKKK